MVHLDDLRVHRMPVGYSGAIDERARARRGSPSGRRPFFRMTAAGQPEGRFDACRGDTPLRGLAHA